MYRISPSLNRFAMALLAGAVAATFWVNLSPASYYDVIEWRILGDHLPSGLLSPGLLLTPASLVSEALMALFVAIIGKELWEAVVMERGPLAGAQIAGPMMLMLGGMAGAVLVWGVVVAIFGLAQDLEGSWGWTAPLGGDVVLAYLFGRLIFGGGHPALKLLLLIAIAELLLALTLGGLLAPISDLRPAWLLLPLFAALAVWWRYGRPLLPQAGLRLQARADAIWPYVIAGSLSWCGVVAAGLPGAIGLLPVLPAIAHANRSFGLFAEAEGLLHDPLNRLAHLLLWPVTGILFLFGLTAGAVDPGAFGGLTLAMIAALWLGKPAGVWLAAMALQRFGSSGPLMAITRGDLVLLLPLMAAAFTGPALGLGWSLPPGVAAEAARLGLALSLLAAPLAVLLARRRG
ncbi:MAG: hypothetical protein MUD11_05355 [Rhodobacteraceae bacterium]|nr:hypothetical protein [Paracoccaceae bacterium]